MSRSWLANNLFFGLIFLQASPAVAARDPEPPDSAGVLQGLSLASFTGSGQNSVQALATDSSGNMYVAGTTSSPDFPVKNAAQPNFAESRIMRTTDLGATWNRVGSPPADVSSVVPDPVVPEVLFAGGDTGIFKTTDGGLIWRRIYQFSGGYRFSAGELVIDPGNHVRMAAIVPFTSRLIRSLDGGETWTAAASPCPISNCGGQLLADPTGSGALLLSGFGVYLSRDWGVSFQPLSVPGKGGTSTAAFDSSHRGWIYADTGVGVQGTFSASTDFGASWTVKASPPTTFSLILNLAVDPDQPNTLVAAALDGFYKSSDGGSSWTPQSASGGAFTLSGHYPFALVSHSCAPSGGLFALGSGAVFGSFQVAFSPDDGATWTTPRLTHVSSVSGGPSCAVYITRQETTDAFVAKISPDGVTLWSTFLGGSDQDAPVGLAVDSQGNAYVTGNTTSPDFPLTVPRIGVPGQSDVFVAKFSGEGRLAYSVLVGGESVNTAAAIAVDLRHNLYIAGSTNSRSFPISSGTLVTQLASGSYTGFLLKLASDASLVYATYLSEASTSPGAILVEPDERVLIAGTGAGPGLPTPPPGTRPEFLVRLDPAASQVASATYLQGTSAYDQGPSALATDEQGNVFVAGDTSIADFTASPAAYISPQSPSRCAAFTYYSGSRAYVIKLAAADWKRIYNAVLQAPCGIQPGAMVVDRADAVVLALATGNGLPLHNPLLGGPACGTNSSAVAKISPDGSALEYATYLDNCGVPGVALANDGSIYAGVSPASYDSSAGVLRLNTATAPAISLDLISNAFSGDATAVVGGGLYSLAGVGFQAPSIDLGLNANQDLPMTLGGVQVRFDGVPAAILQTGPNRVIVVPPSNLPVFSRRDHRLHNAANLDYTAVQLISNGISSNVVWMPAFPSRPGLLTVDFPNLLPFADANARNSDGTLNDPDHPAAAGSTITLFATSMGATNVPVVPGSIAQSDAVMPVTPVYASWRHASLSPPPPENVSSLPGFISAMFQIRIQVPDSIQNLGGTTLNNGVSRVPVALQFALLISDSAPLASNVVEVYLK